MQHAGRKLLILFLGLILIVGSVASCSTVTVVSETGASTSLPPATDPPVSSSTSTTVSPTSPKAAEPATVQHNAELAATLPFADQQDFQDAQRGFVASLPDVTILSEAGTPVWTLKGFEFLQQKDPPATVNPSLWRIAQLNMSNGLFKVTDRVYQIRGFDMSNMTIIEGETGVILIDPLSTAQTAKAGLDLYFQQIGKKPVIAVIYTHSHTDHYGGVKGVISEADVKADKVQVLAPAGFLEAVISENVYAGTAMTRRAGYMYGLYLPRGQFGLVDSGLGKTSPVGAITLIAPTDSVAKTGETRTIDGVEMEFQMVSGTEAPAEMTLYFPQFKVLDSAEIACPLLHNVLTLRGAQVRDPKKWAACLDEDIALYGDRTDVIIAQHNWPRWGQESVVSYLATQRDLYEFINDQTLNLINKGYTPIEIAEMIKLPDSLNKQWYTHSYYGTLSHDVKAVYQKYIGWYDGNPANLNPLIPVDAAKKYVAYMGGAQAVIDKARQDFQKGEYRWVAQVMNQVVFAEPDNAEARYLEADALEQMGYQAEAGTWRSIYLTGALELRNGITKGPGTGGTANPDTIKAMTIPLFFDYWGVRLNAVKADGKTIILNWVFTDPAEQYALNLSNCALTYRVGRQAPKADATFTLTRATLDNITMGQTTFEKEVAAGNIKVVGDASKLAELLGMLDTFSGGFPIVTPE
jgi:alkyl sulfatase BDS1-like metallo-beta-lactamase superfamily hydrolase